MPNVRNKKVVAQNDVSTQLILKGRIGIVSAMTGSANPANAAFTIEASYNDGDDWVTPILLTDPTSAGAAVNNLTGATKSGWARLGGADRVRAKRTDANGGNGDISLTVIEED
jgi:hypothetical protein